MSHLRRPSFSRRHPAHVTLRLVAGLPRLRARGPFRVVCDALAAASRDGFAVTEFSVQGNHLHLMVEADSELALARGMQGLSIRLARALNRRLGRRGRVWADRYHARVLRTPSEVRNALCYVLQNARRHATQSGRRLPARWVDPYSSADTFPGWKERWPRTQPSEVVSQPQTWLLRVGWRRRGLLSVHEVPG